MADKADSDQKSHIPKYALFPNGETSIPGVIPLYQGIFNRLPRCNNSISHRGTFFHRKNVIRKKAVRAHPVLRQVSDSFLGFMLQNTAFIKTTISKTAASPTQKPMFTLKRDTVPNKFIQIPVHFISNTSYFYSSSP